MDPRSTGDKINKEDNLISHNIKALRPMVLEYFIRCRYMYMGASAPSGWRYFQPQGQHLLDLCIVKHHTRLLHM